MTSCQEDNVESQQFSTMNNLSHLGDFYLATKMRPIWNNSYLESLLHVTNDNNSTIVKRNGPTFKRGSITPTSRIASDTLETCFFTLCRCFFFPPSQVYLLPRSFFPQARNGCFFLFLLCFALCYWDVSRDEVPYCRMAHGRDRIDEK